MFEDGKYLEAIAKYKQAIELHGQPSSVLENRIGLSYDALEQYERAVEHYSNAIRIRDNSIDRVNRSLTYHEIGQCDKAVADALVALTLEPAFKAGYHTDVEANYILSDCYFWDEKYLLSFQHIEAAISIAKEHQYPDAEVAFMEEERAIIKSYLE